MTDSGDATRAELALWFIDHDEIDEAARVLVPGDVLELGQSDSLALAAALARRGLSASYDHPRLRVLPADGALATEARRPPARAAAPVAGVAKKTA
ncbi:MAG TPA: hypothetical protein VN914_03610 [Polyangia bacterium]|nr:hypothetical protein [Polyangia bacterium]